MHKNDCVISLDLNYLHIPIHYSHRKYFRYFIQRKAYQFKALCFGPSSKSLYKNNNNSTSLSSGPKHQDFVISRRLVDSKFFSRESTIRSRESAQFVTATRFCNQPEEVTPNSQSEHSVLRGSIQSRSGISLTNSRQNSEFIVSCLTKSHVIRT